ncbi:hypothetical protein [Dactylosporangium sp. CA-139066]|uniref:hypothetical protein n=1 Tax=Dactylosporangium sp. CA-139066 TaxID=3239930 RepID=UPI003D8E6237
MELLIGAAVYALIIQKLWAAARTDHELAKQGKISPRLEAKYGAGARAKVEQYGFFDYLRDAYHDFWGRRGDALAAARTAQPEPDRPRVRFRDRLAAASNALTRVARRAAPVARRLIEPVERRPEVDAPATPPEPEPALAVDRGDVPEGTKRYTDAGVEEFFDGQWRPVPTTPDTFNAPPTNPAPTAPPAGETMTAPTGEVTNFASAIPEIDALISLIQVQHDQASATLRALQLVDNAIDGMQDRQKTIAGAAVALSEHLAALHLDAGSLGPVMDAAEVLSGGVVDEMLEYLERLRKIVMKVIASCDAAITCLRAARSSLVAKYADAAATVEENLGGDSRFLAGDSTAPAASPS